MELSCVPSMMPGVFVPWKLHTDTRRVSPALISGLGPSPSVECPAATLWRLYHTLSFPNQSPKPPALNVWFLVFFFRGVSNFNTLKTVRHFVPSQPITPTLGFKVWFLAFFFRGVSNFNTLKTDTTCPFPTNNTDPRLKCLVSGLSPPPLSASCLFFFFLIH